MGGVVNMITRQDATEGVSFKGYGSYGGFNTVKGGGNLSYGKDRFTVGINLNHLSTDGHRNDAGFLNRSLHSFAGFRLNEHWNARAGLTLSSSSFMDPGPDYIIPSIPFDGDIARQMATYSLSNRYDRLSGGVYGFFNSGEHHFSDGWSSTDRNFGVNVFQQLDTWKGGTLTLGADLKQYGGKGSLGVCVCVLESTPASQ